jgi:hypothetical protein
MLPYGGWDTWVGIWMDDEPTEASMKNEFPDWEIFDGSNPGPRHARRRQSSPPVIVRGEDWRDLRDEIVRAVDRLTQRDYWQRELEDREAQQRRHDDERWR